MCNSEVCLGYLLLSIVLGFSVLIFFLLRYRKSLLANDLQISAEQVWQNRPQILQNKNISKANMIFGVWVDKAASVSEMVIKNSNDEIVGLVEHRWGSREYIFTLGQQAFRVNLPINWGGSAAQLTSDDGKVLASYQRKSFSVANHEYTILNTGVLKSKRYLYSFRQPIEYNLNEKFVAMTYQISSFRKIGRVGVFSLDSPLPIKIFMLAICF